MFSNYMYSGINMYRPFGNTVPYGTVPYNNTVVLYRCIVRYVCGSYNRAVRYRYRKVMLPRTWLTGCKQRIKVVCGPCLGIAGLHCPRRTFHGAYCHWGWGSPWSSRSCILTGARPSSGGTWHAQLSDDVGRMWKGREGGGSREGHMCP